MFLYQTIKTKKNLGNIQAGYVIPKFRHITPTYKSKTIFATFTIAFEIKNIRPKMSRIWSKKYVMLCDFELDTMAYSHK